MRLIEEVRLMAKTMSAMDQSGTGYHARVLRAIEAGMMMRGIIGAECYCFEYRDGDGGMCELCSASKAWDSAIGDSNDSA